MSNKHKKMSLSDKKINETFELLKIKTEKDRNSILNKAKPVEVEDKSCDKLKTHYYSSSNS